MKTKTLCAFVVAMIALTPLIGVVARRDYAAEQARLQVGTMYDTLPAGTLVLDPSVEIEPPEKSENRLPALSGAEYAALLNEFYEAESAVYIEDDPVPTADKPVRYVLTSEERDYIERVIMSESGNTEPFEGQKLIAQCILNACEMEGARPFEAMRRYGYSIINPEEPNESVRAAISAVFDNGEVITNEPVLYYYNPDLTAERWHETQEYVCTVGRHRFFKKWSE